VKRRGIKAIELGAASPHHRPDTVAALEAMCDRPRAIRQSITHCSENDLQRLRVSALISQASSQEQKSSMKSNAIFAAIAILTSAGSGAFAQDNVASSSFKAIVNRCLTVYESRKVPRPGLQVVRGHSLTRYGEVSSSYDIRRTDSLVSPFVANIDLKFVVEMTDFFPDQEAVINQPFTPRFFSTQAFTFAFQDGEWVYKSMTTSNQFIKDGRPQAPMKINDKPAKSADGSSPPAFVCAYGAQ
jgi:hypothetical protein